MYFIQRREADSCGSRVRARIIRRALHYGFFNRELNGSFTGKLDAAKNATRIGRDTKVHTMVQCGIQSKAGSL